MSGSETVGFEEVPPTVDGLMRALQGRGAAEQSSAQSQECQYGLRRVRNLRRASVIPGLPGPQRNTPANKQPVAVTIEADKKFFQFYVSERRTAVGSCPVARLRNQSRN